MRISLKVEAGPHEGQVFEFEGHSNFIVGRSRRAHFRLPDKDKYFSRVHFMIEVNPPLSRLMDMGSTNGTLGRCGSVGHVRKSLPQYSRCRTTISWQPRGSRFHIFLPLPTRV